MRKYPLGTFQDEVLRVLLLKNGESYITEINKVLCDKLKRYLLTPQVQVAMKRLEERGLVIQLREEVGKRGGRKRKIFGLTQAGRQSIGQSVSATELPGHAVGAPPTYCPA